MSQMGGVKKTGGSITCHALPIFLRPADSANGNGGDMFQCPSAHYAA